MKDQFDWLKFADDLESLLGGKISNDEIISKYKRAHKLGEEIDHVLCNLYHFLSDGDIREKDAEYRHMQEQEMRKLIDLIHKGNIEKAKEVDFLHES